MRNDGRIPIIIGVTGHRDLREEDTEILKDAVRNAVRFVQGKCPHSDIAVMTGLAEGADQLCAETALEMGLDIISVLPMPIDEYAEDFAGRPLDKLYELAERSAKTFIADRMEPYTEGRDYLYRQAGICIAGSCHILMALWDGAPGEPGGCGTAAIAGIALRNSNRAAGEQLRHASGAVMQIVTPRRSSEEKDLTAGEMILHGDIGFCEKIIKDTDSYNKDCMRLMQSAADRNPENTVPPEKGAGDTDEKLKSVYDASDQLSMINAVRHRRTLIGLSVCATVLAVAFLLYDEVDWHWMILLCGIMIVSLFAINAVTDRTRFHARYLEYRILAETCRVQTYLRTAGSRCEAAAIMPWSLQVAVPWVGKALSAIMAGGEVSGKKSILDMWILNQRDYHRNALVRTETQLKRNDRIIRIALIFTLLIYLAAFLFEILCGGMFGAEVRFPPEVNAVIRTVIKVALGAFSAGTLFANNYYGKQALPDVMDDHRKMALLFEEAGHEIAEKGETEPLLIRIAEDELEENANWYAYQSKHEPDLGI